ncbi:hypothetical protein DYB26_007124 [Aphanomyces astaci]|uniref:Uncharacterized protein n=2 Tax=Aphanomyces astaci TaxID=112090 RepID=A0A397FG90_APHAT|nr:hypothetical protein DYB31_005438 [Aphanomyces astaci]RHZ30168.1 hypothetical protein DYB26_007124 [Aphanomyces astaci]
MMLSPRWSTLTSATPSSWAVTVWTPEKDEHLAAYVSSSIRVSLEASTEEVDQDLERAVYATRFPLGVNWKALSLELDCSPMDCVRRYAELKTPHVPSEEEVRVVHSPRLDELLSSSHRSSSPMLSPPPFALRSEHRNSPFIWEDVSSSNDNISLDDSEDLHAIEIEELSRDLNSALTHDDDDALPLGSCHQMSTLCSIP